MKLENAYQAKLIKRIQTIFPDCFILRNDPLRNQGIPDLLLLFGASWAMLEVKLSKGAEVQPNQEFYVDMFNRLSFASFIYPENEDEVLYALQTKFRNEKLENECYG
jgi:hypothetical protein